MNTLAQRIRGDLHRRINQVLDPLARGLTRLAVEPNQVTVAGTLLNVVAAGLILDGRLLAAGVVWLVAGGFDLLDGALARAGRMVTSFGAFLDSTLDRASEGVVLAAIAYHFAAHAQPAYAALVVLALLGSVLVSYTRARAEALGAECKVGILTRAERVLIIGVGLCVNLLPLAVWVLLVLSWLTVAQRVLHARRGLSKK
ncbi:MAG: CDP-alcohol phosphatidyltransferase family protein [Gammaproteobacteria bacterium]|nr:CDP-alcohol phosphatidyltransferase family protein [Gammaproteobacteria bacterium]NIR83106.1 CDP-alcohol phosphatidyltransferase family protein [Gammaproteobacteria bacterium]NIR90768.1 CDP-alcohol phosphatidyltransferase family protein [Gammaproteobacteria bacterium]NIU04259.1 CDP-alcohol phosphatidyltransferase family protein [Gammaproteobacteria bacterium]NIV51551.1 CDP-alcohol phosphatidyltransferase family protein [Gammaproteobacteria bacterium]